MSRFTSRKFLLALLAALIAFGNSFWNWGLEFNEILAIIAPILAFIGMEGWADVKRAENE